MLPYLIKTGDRMNKLIEETRSYYKENFGVTISKIVKLEDLKLGLEYYQKNMSEGKVILKPKF